MYAHPHLDFYRSGMRWTHITQPIQRASAPAHLSAARSAFGSAGRRRCLQRAPRQRVTSRQLCPRRAWRVREWQARCRRSLIAPQAGAKRDEGNLARRRRCCCCCCHSAVSPRCPLAAAESALLSSPPAQPSPSPACAPIPSGARSVRCQQAKPPVQPNRPPARPPACTVPARLRTTCARPTPARSLTTPPAAPVTRQDRERAGQSGRRHRRPPPLGPCTCALSEPVNSLAPA